MPFRLMTIRDVLLACSSVQRVLCCRFIVREVRGTSADNEGCWTLSAIEKDGRALVGHLDRDCWGPRPGLLGRNEVSTAFLPGFYFSELVDCDIQSQAITSICIHRGTSFRLFGASNCPACTPISSAE